MHRLAIELDRARVRDDRPAQRLDQRRLAGAIVAEDREASAGQQVEIAIFEGNAPAVAFAETPGLENRSVVHAEILLIHWSMVTATIISTPTAKSCHSNSR